MKRLGLVLCLLALAGCAPPGESVEEPHEDSERTRIGYGTYRIVDSDAGVVCWHYFQVAISCLPLADTWLAE